MTTNFAPFPVEPRLTQIAMAVKPTGMIADLVCPRIQVEGKKFIYTTLTTSESFTIPDTKVGRTSAPNEVEFGGTDVTDSCDDYGLDDFVPTEDVELAASNSNFDPMGRAAETTALLLQLAREKRVADLYFTKANYSASLSATLSSSSPYQWNDATHGDPVASIMNAIDSMLVHPNILLLGAKTWSILRRDTKLVAAILGTKGQAASTASAGVLSRQAVADLFELDDIIVGQPWANTAKPGQTASYSRLWGAHAALLRIDPAVRNVRGGAMPTFGFTAQWGTMISGTISEPKRGLKGGNIVRVGEQVKELICFKDVGYFFENAVSAS